MKIAPAIACWFYGWLVIADRLGSELGVKGLSLVSESAVVRVAGREYRRTVTVRLGRLETEKTVELTPFGWGC